VRALLIVILIALVLLACDKDESTSPSNIKTEIEAYIITEIGGYTATEFYAKYPDDYFPLAIVLSVDKENKLMKGRVKFSNIGWFDFSSEYTLQIEQSVYIPAADSLFPVDSLYHIDSPLHIEGFYIYQLKVTDDKLNGRFCYIGIIADFGNYEIVATRGFLYE